MVVYFYLFLICIFIGFLILAYGYCSGKAVRPVEPNVDIIRLENEIKREVESDVADIDTPRNYELDNCNKHGFQQQDVLIYIDNDSLKYDKALKIYIAKVNERLQKIFPYDKRCYDSVVIHAQYFDVKKDSTIDKRYSFPMIK